MLAYLSFPPWLHPEIIPGLPLRWYGMMYLVAFVVAYTIVRVQVRERKLNVPRDEVLNLFFWGIVGLLVGARLFAVTIYDPSGYYLRHPLQIIVPLSVSGGRMRFTGLAGMSYHGGLTGAVAAMVIYLRVKRMPVLDWGDMIVTGSALGYTFGRLGNFINGELYGRVTALPWGMVFPLAERFPAKEAWVQQFASRIGMNLAGMGASVNLPRHPSQLYEAFFEGIVLWAILWFVFRKRKAFPGQLLAIYIMGYGLIRFLIEYVREPDADMGFPIQLVHLQNPYVDFSLLNFTTGQILNTIMIATGVCCYLLFRGYDRRVQAAKARKEAARPQGKELRKLRKKLR
jgi:phosphatidylglycerol:prolipoprotein diacylglycerol transferase